MIRYVLWQRGINSPNWVFTTSFEDGEIANSVLDSMSLYFDVSARWKLEEVIDKSY